jgi:L-lactate dehydrogenase complex protein LldE
MCLQIGFAALDLLEQGAMWEVPQQQTCCGQPAHNSGGRRGGGVPARQVIVRFL